MTTVRLDAVGYAVKTPGTDSFMTPETLDFRARDRRPRPRGGPAGAGSRGARATRSGEPSRPARGLRPCRLRPGAVAAAQPGHGHLRPARRMVLRIRPRNAITVLDTHDGIGIVDAGPSGDLPGPHRSGRRWPRSSRARRRGDGRASTVASRSSPPG
ncbi:hypothetical protein ACRAWD_21900 [Caulobacter segnis]